MQFFSLWKWGKKKSIGQRFLSLGIHSLQVPDKIACALHITGQILAPLKAMIFFFVDLNRTKIQEGQNETGMSALGKQHSCQQTSLTVFYISLLSLILKSVKFLASKVLLKTTVV